MKERAGKDLRCKWIKWILTAGIMALMGISYSCSLNGAGQEEGLLLSGADEGSREEDTPGSFGEEGVLEQGDTVPVAGGFGGESRAGEDTGTCFVHICGAVAAPGVYRMPEGSRIYQAVEAAGGFLPQADEGYLNLAAQIQDGMKITVYTREETETALSSEALSPEGQPGREGELKEGKVNINTAGREELMALKGIGESRAEDIIAYREKHGAFSEIEEIMQVPGIKDGAFQKIKDRITVR